MLEGFDAADLAAAAALRAEWRADEDAWARAALEQWEHDRTLLDVLRTCMHRGDTVAFEFTGRTFVGALSAVGADLARLATTDGSVDAHLDGAAVLVVRVVVAARAGGGRGDRSITTFRARLLHLEGTLVELGTRVHDDALIGELGVGRDQVRVLDGDGAARYVPIGSVNWVRPVDVD